MHQSTSGRRENAADSHDAFHEDVATPQGGKTEPLVHQSMEPQNTKVRYLFGFGPFVSRTE